MVLDMASLIPVLLRVATTALLASDKQRSEKQCKGGALEMEAH